jgi:hypothetical protein
VDVSLKGTSVEPDVDDMEAAYGEGTTPADVLQVRKSASACVLWPYAVQCAILDSVHCASSRRQLVRQQ